MHNEIELSFGNVLILLICLAMTYWMSRAPKSILKLMSNRYRGIGLDGDRPLLTAIVRNFGRFTFFMLVNGLLIMVADKVWPSPWSSLVTFALALGISVFALRRRKQPDLYATLSGPPPSGSGRPNP